MSKVLRRALLSVGMDAPEARALSELIKAEAHEFLEPGQAIDWQHCQEILLPDPPTKPAKVLMCSVESTRAWAEAHVCEGAPALCVYVRHGRAGEARDERKCALAFAVGVGRA